MLAVASRPVSDGEIGGRGVYVPGWAFAAGAGWSYAPGSFCSGADKRRHRDSALDNHTGGGNMTSATLFFAAITLTAATAIGGSRTSRRTRRWTGSRHQCRTGSCSSAVRASAVGCAEVVPDLPVVNRGFGGSQLADSVPLCRSHPHPVPAEDGGALCGGQRPGRGQVARAGAGRLQGVCGQGAWGATRHADRLCGGEAEPKRWALIEKVRETNRLIARQPSRIRGRHSSMWRSRCSRPRVSRGRSCFGPTNCTLTTRGTSVDGAGSATP